MATFSNFRKHLKIQFGYLFIYQRRVLNSFLFNINIKKRIKQFPQFKTAQKDRIYLNSCRKFLKKNFPGFKNTNWHYYYSVLNGVKSTEFIPDKLFYTMIEPTLNKYDFITAYNDKVSHDNLFKKDQLPETVFKVLNGNFYDSDNYLIEKEVAYLHLSSFDEELVLKPSIFSGGGKNVVIEKAQEIAKLIKNQPSLANGSFIIQKKVKQHYQMAKFHPSSLNTCRIMTARIENKIVVLAAYIRFGRNKSKIDNAQSGGIFCCIDQKGKLSDFAIDKLVNRFEKHPDTGQKFSGFIIPNYNIVKEFCLINHHRFLRFTFISWDIAINEDGSPVFIEFNLKNQAINGHQILNGPLFGEYTEKLLKKYNEERKKDILNI